MGSTKNGEDNCKIQQLMNVGYAATSISQEYAMEAAKKAFT